MTDDPTMGAPEPTAEPSPPVLSHLVYLDVDDEITSAASRIRGSRAEQVTLVLPYGSRLATSRINFRLLAREATERSKRLDIVSGDASARALAAAAGLPVHASVAAFEGRGSAPPGAEPGSTNGSDAATTGGATRVDDATAFGVAAGDAVAAGGAAAAVAGAAAADAGPATQISLPKLADEDDAPTRVITAPRRSSQRVPLVGPARPPVPPRVVAAAALGGITVLVILGLLGVQLLPAATIVLHPRSADLGPLELAVQARADVTAPDAANLVIPAQRFTFPLEATDTFTATGKKVVEAKATGNVTFSNFDTGSANRIEAGAIVKTRDDVEFMTLATVTLPNATVQFPFTIVPSTSTVGVEAVLTGPEGNVGNNTIVVVPKGENKRLLQVTNVEATSGGAHTEATVVSDADIASAQTALDAAMRLQLETQVGAGTGVPSGVTLFPQTATVGPPTPSVDPATLVGTEVADFELGATAEGSVLGVDPSPIQAIAESRLETQPDEGWSLAPGSASFTLGEPSVFGDVISYPVTASATQVRDVDQAQLRAEVHGLVLAQARARLDDFGDVSISLWPDWVTTIPTNDDRIEFTIAGPQPAPSPTP
jgi:hypothetical protein